MTEVDQGFPASNSESLPNTSTGSQIVESGLIMPLVDGVAPAFIDEALVVDFESMSLEPEISAALVAIGWKTPTKVQSLCLPLTLKGRDLAGFAQTGTGKTGVFLITIVNSIVKERNGRGDAHLLPADGASTPETTRATLAKKSAPHAVVLVPTRELAMQVSDDAKDLFGNLHVKFLAVFGGTAYEQQANELKDGVDVIIATPGRLKDYFQKGLIELDDCKILVCDEADRMFDMGFIDDAEYFLSRISESGQRLLFSATTNDNVKELAFEYLEAPVYISVNPEQITPDNIDQKAIICESVTKVRVLLGLIKDENPDRAIVFTNTKMVADWLHYKLLHNGLDVDVITGDLPQKKRIALIQKIKRGDIKYLIATDVASRGLHISGVTHVFNFDIPEDPANYIHRIGRTARAGAKGKSISLVCEDYGQNLEAIMALLGDSIPITTKWHDEAYLSIEDKSGNPYKDPEFRGSSEYQEAKEQRRVDQKERQRHKDKSARHGEDANARRGSSSHHSKGGKQDHKGHHKDKAPEDRKRSKGRDRDKRHHNDREGAFVDGRDGHHGEAKSRHKHDKSSQHGRSNHPTQKHSQGSEKRGVHSSPGGALSKADAVPQSVMGMLKSLFKSFLGLKKK